MNRRDRCYLVGKRALTLSPQQMQVAWKLLADEMEDKLGSMDMPKFKDLMKSIRRATIEAASDSIEPANHGGFNPPQPWPEEMFDKPINDVIRRRRRT